MSEKYWVLIEFQDSADERHEDDEPLVRFEFGTEAELEAFLRGVEAMSGWDKYELVNTNCDVY